MEGKSTSENTYENKQQTFDAQKLVRGKSLPVPAGEKEDTGGEMERGMEDGGEGGMC